MARPSLTTNMVQNFVSNFDYKLIGKYTHSQKRIVLMCPRGHINTYLFSQFKRGNRCPDCNKENKQEQRINKFKSFVEENSNYEFIELIGARTLKLKCDQGHVYDVVWDSFFKGHRCPKCAGNKKYTYEEVKLFIENEGYKITDKKYRNANDNLHLICPNRHEYITTFNSFRLGYRCGKCYSESKFGEHSPNWKGGLSPLANFMRGKIGQWKKDSLKEYDYKCVITDQNSKHLEIHHLYSFTNILNEVLEELKLKKDYDISDYTENQLNNIEKLLIKKHYEYGLGVPLLPEIHKLFHMKYGYGNNTKEQFIEFYGSFKNK